MSTLKADTITAKTADGAVTIQGNGTGTVAIADNTAITGDLTTTGTVEPAGDTSAGDNAAIGYTSAEGLILTGQGSTNDITIKRDDDTAVLEVATGQSDIEVTGGSIIFGTASEGVYLGVTSATAANLLDDYEEGTWTPAQNVVTAAASSGAYTKIGRLVIANFTMTTATTADTSSMLITGLPFAAATIDGDVCLGYDNYAVSNTSHAYVPSGATYLQMIQNSSGGSTNAVHSGKILKGAAIYFSAT